MESPLFLVGAERSGTTLLRLMLEGHPQIACPADFDFALDWPAHRPGEPRSVLDFWDRLSQSRQARRHRVVIHGELDVPGLTRSLLAQLGARTRKPIFGVTAHHHFARILALWPDARFIYLLRDGRDVARSYVERGLAGNVWAAASVWREAEREWAQLCARLPAERRIELRYEDLVRQPERVLARVCAFLDVDPTPEMLAFPARTRHEAPDPRLAERWREKLSHRELAWLEREIGSELRARGYAESLVPAAWIPAPRRMALRAGDRFGRASFRLRRYGARLWAGHPLARRFRIARLAQLTAQRMQAIDAAVIR